MDIYTYSELLQSSHRKRWR